MHTASVSFPGSASGATNIPLPFGTEGQARRNICGNVRLIILFLTAYESGVPQHVPR